MTDIKLTETKNLTVSRIFSNKRKDVEKSILKLNKKCTRFGVNNPTIIFSDVYEYSFTDGTYEDDPFAVVEARYKWYSIDVFDITIKLPEDIKIGDWEAIAYIDHFERQYVQFDIDADYDYDFESQIDNKNCEHCNTKRNRKKSFILKSVIDGSFKKVGSTCVKDFTGVDPTKFFKAFRHILYTMKEFDGFEIFGEGRTQVTSDYRVFDINHIWTISNKVIDVDGEYIKTEWTEVEHPIYRGQFEKIRTNLGDATSDKVKNILFKYDRESDYFVKPTEVDEELVKGMREWLENMEIRIGTYENEDGGKEEFENEFDVKLKGYKERKRVRTFDIGFTAWIVDAYLKYVKSLSEPISEYVGEVDEKVKIEATITLISVIYNEWGSSNLYKMVDSKGNVFSKFGTINIRYSIDKEIKEGSVLKMTAVVKKHNEFRGKKETLLGRISKY